MQSRTAPRRHEELVIETLPFIGAGLADILCVQELRTVANDNTVRYGNRILQIPESHRCQ
jgi:hypothetical protein